MDEEPLPRVQRRKLEPAREFDKILAGITGVNPESIKEVERIIETPEGIVRHTYDIQVDSTTGKQKVIEKFKTYKKECSICGGYFGQIFTCEKCGTKVCANDMRRQEWSYQVDRYGRPAGLYDHDNKFDHFEDKERLLCRHCYKTLEGEDV